MATDNRSLQKIKILLQDAEVQARVRENIRKGREEAKVTIGRAAELFDVKPSKLRELDQLLKPERSTGTETGQRQYSLTELKKLAIISELLKEGCSNTEIPPDIDRVWQGITDPEIQQEREIEEREDTVKYLPINQRIENARKELFWGYFASHVLRMSLILMSEDIPGTTTGLVLPLEMKVPPTSVQNIEDLPKLGESLIGWLSQSGSSHLLLTSRPSFDYSSDYRLQPLAVMKAGVAEEDIPQDNTFIIIRRAVRPLTLSEEVVETIRRLLKPLYQERQLLQSCFGLGMRDVMISAPNLENSAIYPDIILDDFANTILRLGGQIAPNQNRWRFCCILLPDDTMLPLQQRSLVVRAQSTNAPHKVGIAKVSPEKDSSSLSLRAFQSGCIIYRHNILPKDSTIALREVEGSIRSAIAVPVGGEDGQPVAVFYIGSDEQDAFSQADQRVLRIISKMIEELLRTYETRLQVIRNLGKMIEYPSIVDRVFEEFASENEFIRDVEDVLSTIKTHLEMFSEEVPQEVISFIAIDIDNQGSLANKYGDHVTRNLSREVGFRIRERLNSIFSKHIDYRLYRISADRFYILLNGIPLERARDDAERLRNALNGSYKIDAQRIFIDQPTRPDAKLNLTGITVRLGVTSYAHVKLAENLASSAPETVITEFTGRIIRALDEALKKGMDEGGNVVISWDNNIREFVRWSPC